MSIKQHLSSCALVAATSFAAFAVFPAVSQQPVWSLPGSTPSATSATSPATAAISSSTPAPAPAPVTAPAPQQEAAAPVPKPVPASTPAPGVAEDSGDVVRNKYYKPIAGKKNKFEYVGPKDLIELAPAPMLDQEGRQRIDPDGKPMFNPPIRQQRDRRGNPSFDMQLKPVFQTEIDLGYDEKGKRIHVKKVKPPKLVSVFIERGTLTVDGMTGKAGLNYDIKDLKFIYIYAPWIGITIVSHTPFPGAIEQKDAFNDKTLTVTVEEHTLQIYSDRRLLGKKTESAFVAVDRDFKVPSTFPVMGYGETLKPPYAWPGSRENAALKGPVAPPPLPASVRAVTLLQPCPPGQMRMPGRVPLPGENLPPQPCVAITKALPGVGAPKPSAPATAPVQVSTPTPESSPKPAEAVSTTATQQ